MKLSTPSAGVCRCCPRLSLFLDEVKLAHPEYHAAPVAPFGPAGSGFLIVGLAPGMHGANRTGRPFTGDHAGILLYESLYKFGFATQSQSLNESGNADANLHLINCRVTNAVRCLPPQNKPETREVIECNHYLASELALVPDGGAVLALGAIAHHAVLRAQQLRKADYVFSHGAQHLMPSGLTLFDSYHCSRYNTQTRRLTTAMFESVISSVVAHLEPG